MFKNKEDSRVAGEIGNSNNIVGKGTIVKGNIETLGNIRIEGKVIGNVKTKSKIALGQSCQVKGDVVAQNAEISGEVNGTIEIADVLILRPTAVINGDILTNKLIVESGASLNGGCKMSVMPKEIKIGDQGPGSNGGSNQEQARAPA